MTDDWLTDEWQYIRDERLAILCPVGQPAEWMLDLARKEANEAIERLKNESAVVDH